eukprot:scaffold1065_cov335-Pinguiococcus_pyrenoidosus.AAC.1
MDGNGFSYSTEVGCPGLSVAREVDPILRLVPTDANENTELLDPTTPQFTNEAQTELSPAYSNVDPIPDGDTFFEQTPYLGAFGDSNNWLASWSLLSESGQLGDLSPQPDDSSDGDSDDNENLVVGLAVGLTVFVVILIGVAVYSYFRIKKYKTQYEKLQLSYDHEADAEYGGGEGKAGEI